MTIWQKFKTKLKKNRNVLQVARLIWQTSPYLTVANFVLVMIIGGMEMCVLYSIKLMVDSFSGGGAGKALNLFKIEVGGDVLSRVGLFVGIAACAALIGALSRTLAGYFSQRQTLPLMDLIYEKLHAKSVEVDLEYYENAKYYNTMHLAQRNAPVRAPKLLSEFIQIGQYGVSLAAIIGLLTYLHWSITLVLLVAFLPGVFVRMRFADRMFNWQKVSSQRERWAEYYSTMITGEPHAKELRLFGLGDLFCERFRNVREKLREEKLGLIKGLCIEEALVSVMTVSLIFGSYAFIAFNAVKGAFTLGDVVLYFTALQRGQAFLSMAMANLSALYEDSLFLSYFHEFLQIKTKIQDPPRPVKMPRRLEQGIRFENVHFTYPNTDHEVLHDISLEIRPGEKVALVGDNGSGKTTLIKLLSRLYDVTSGSVLVDGIDVRQFEVEALRKEMSVVFQDYVHYNLTAKENIWLGDVKAGLDLEKIQEAARLGGADSFIRRYERKYETQLGRLFEDGQQLSIGQWQKVAIARAFFRPAQVIVLDEPSSAMDPLSEYELFKKFYQLSEGKTAIFISHRLSTVTMADRIYMMQGGRVVEAGSHQELIEQQGAYANLFETQAQYYR